MDDAGVSKSVKEADLKSAGASLVGSIPTARILELYPEYKIVYGPYVTSEQQANEKYVAPHVKQTYLRNEGSTPSRGTIWVTSFTTNTADWPDAR